MIKENMIVSLIESIDWIHPVVPKYNGGIRVSMVLKSLNGYIKRELFPIPTINGFLSESSVAKYFTLLDASQSFLQTPFNESSSKFWTNRLATSWDKYSYRSLPFRSISKTRDLVE